MPFLLAYSVGYTLTRALIGVLKLAVLLLVAIVQFVWWLVCGTSATYPILRTTHPPAHDGTDDNGGGWGRDSPRAPDPPPSLTDTRP